MLLSEMGLALPASTAIRVWDTSGESRFMVLPMRPANTDGWSEERLAAIVTREAMIGVAAVETR
jgi:nitrile hydratase